MSRTYNGTVLVVIGRGRHTRRFTNYTHNQ